MLPSRTSTRISWLVGTMCAALCAVAMAAAPVLADGKIVLASWYGEAFANRPTASGEIFDPSELTAAHRTLPFGTRLVVTNLRNGRSVRVTVTDRGPYWGDRALDLSHAAAKAIGMVRDGVVRVQIERIDL